MTLSRILICATFYSAVNSLFADTTHGLPSSDMAIVFADSARFYSEPSNDSGLLCSLSPGTPVHELVSTGISARQNGILSPWMSGVCEIDGVRRNGFILMADLALTELNLGNDTLFLFGLDSLRTAGFSFWGHAETVVGGNVLQRIQLSTPIGFQNDGGFYYSVSSRLLDHEQFPDMDCLLVLGFDYPACGYVNSQVLFAWSDRSLVMGPSADWVAEAGLFHTIEEFLFPGDGGTTPGILGVSFYHERYNDGAYNEMIVESDTTWYEWTGASFSEL